MSTMTRLPAGLYSRIHTLGYFSMPHISRPDQLEAKNALYKTLTQGEIDELPNALRRHGMAWNKDINGRYIEGENLVSDNAYQLAREVELVISKSQQKQAA